MQLVGDFHPLSEQHCRVWTRHRTQIYPSSEHPRIRQVRRCVIAANVRVHVNAQGGK
jgi:hypothetical protein